MSVMTKDEFLTTSDTTSVDVLVPEIAVGKVIRLAPMDVAGLEAWEYSLMSRRGKDGKLQDTRGLRVQLVVASVVDENGKRLFTDADIPALEKVCGVVMERLADEAMDLNGLSDKKLKEMAKNSEADQNSVPG